MDFLDKRKWIKLITRRPSLKEMLKENPSGRRIMIPEKKLHLKKELKSAGNVIDKGKDKTHFFLIFKCSKI